LLVASSSTVVKKIGFCGFVLHFYKVLHCQFQKLMVGLMIIVDAKQSFSKFS